MQKYNLYINPNDLKAMRQDIWSEDYIPGTLWIDKDKYTIEISYRGHSTRKYKKKSYHIVFKQPFFMDGAHEIHLNAEYNDPSLLRNKLSLDYFSKIGVISPQSQHILLYMNGIFQGIYLQLESFDQYSLKKRNLPDGSIFYATNNDANFSLLTAEGDMKTDILQGYTEKYSNNEGKQSLLELLIKINTLADHDFNNEIQKVLDIEKYLLWLAGVVCTQNFDGFVHNYALYLNSDTKLFEITPWDYDGTWGRTRHGDILEYNYIPIEGFNTLTARLLKNLSNREKYRSLMDEILTHHFTNESQLPTIEALCSMLSPYIIKDPYIKHRFNVFQKEPEFITTFIEERNQFLKNELLRLSEN